MHADLRRDQSDSARSINVLSLALRETSFGVAIPIDDRVVLTTANERMRNKQSDGAQCQTDTCRNLAALVDALLDHRREVFAVEFKQVVALAEQTQRATHNQFFGTWRCTTFKSHRERAADASEVIELDPGTLPVVDNVLPGRPRGPT